MTGQQELAGRVIIISGGSEGIGLGMATRLARLGGSVVIASRDRGKGEAAVEHIVKAADCQPADVCYCRTDITSEGDNEAVVQFAVDRYGRLDAAINNAVYPGDFQLLADEPVESFELVMKTNVTGTYLGMKHQIRQFLAQDARQGDNYSIINVSSGATRDTGMRMAPYIASKLAVEGLTRAAALEYAGRGIRVNALLFGVFDTDKSRALHEAMPAALEKNRAKHHLGRFGNPDSDAGEAAAYLISSRSSFVTGTTMFVDGGMCL